MKTHKRVAWAALAMLVLANGLLAGTPAAAALVGCLPDMGKKVPVLFVHGFLGKASDWRPFQSIVTDKIGARTEAFDYQQYNHQWVTDPHIGKALAERITCIGTSSRQQGGKGKVIVVAHSMGGLATRQAIAESPEAAKALGMVITIGTPNTGSSIDRASLDLALSLCQLGAGQGVALQCLAALQALEKSLTAIPGLAAGSKEIRVLPGWPKSLPVYAIAGNITPHYNLFGLEFDGPPSNSDTLVTTASALHGVKANGLGGSREFPCRGGPPPVLPSWTKGSCEHGALINDPGVQTQVVGAIKAYVAKTAKPPKPQRKLPEFCPKTALYQGPGYTSHAAATVTKGTVTCDEASALAQSYLEESGPEPTTVIGDWTCRVISTDSRGFVAECIGPKGTVRISGE